MPTQPLPTNLEVAERERDDVGRTRHLGLDERLLAHVVPREAARDLVLHHAVNHGDLHGATLDEKHLVAVLALHDDVLVGQRDDRHQLGDDLNEAGEREALEEVDPLDELTLERDVELDLHGGGRREEAAGR